MAQHAEVMAKETFPDCKVLQELARGFSSVLNCPVEAKEELYGVNRIFAEFKKAKDSDLDEQGHDPRTLLTMCHRLNQDVYCFRISRKSAPDLNGGLTRFIPGTKTRKAEKAMMAKISGVLKETLGNDSAITIKFGNIYETRNRGSDYCYHINNI